MIYSGTGVTPNIADFVKQAQFHLTDGTQRFINRLTALAGGNQGNFYVTGIQESGVTALIDDAIALYYDKAEIDAKLVDYYTQDQIDTILEDYYTSAQVDTTLADYYTKSAVDSIIAAYYTKTQIDTYLADYYTKVQIDANNYTKAQIDTLLSGYYTQAQIDTLNYTKTQIDAYLANYYTKVQIDAGNYTKAQIDTLFSSYYTKTQIDTINYTKGQVDTLLGSYYTQTQIDANNYTKTQIDANNYTKTQIDTNNYTKIQVDALLAAISVSSLRDGLRLLNQYQREWSLMFSYTVDCDASPVVVSVGAAGLLTLSGVPSKFQDFTNSGITNSIVSAASNNLTLNLTALRTALSNADVATALNKTYSAGGPPYSADSWFKVVIQTTLAVTTTTDSTQGQLKLQCAAGQPGSAYTTGNLAANTIYDPIMLRSHDSVKAYYQEQGNTGQLDFGTTIYIAAGAQSLSNTVRIRSYQLKVRVGLQIY